LISGAIRGFEVILKDFVKVLAKPKPLGSALLHTENGVSATNQYHRQILEAINKKNPRLAEKLV